MATPNEKLATSLSELKKLQSDGRKIFQSKELSRIHRERLLKLGFIAEVMKGWLISSSPDSAEGDSTPWYASFWEFCARYCNERFGNAWHLSPEQSLLLHAESNVIPPQVIIYAPKGTLNTLELLFGTSLYDLKQEHMPPKGDIIERDGLHLFSVPAAIIKVPENFYQRYPIEAQVSLSNIGDSSEVLGRLLDGGHSVVAGRLVGAFRRIGRADIADDILSAMKAAGYDVRESDPFTEEQKFTELRAGVSPIVGRLEAMWQSSRDVILDVFPPAPGLPKNQKAYLKFVDEIYKSDAYHSLSIEGYRVTPELIEQVRSGNWGPDHDDDDRGGRNALAARGYWQAFQLVKEAVTMIIGGEEPAAILRTAHRDWYRELFQPSVAAGIIQASALAGYRNDAVYLRGSRYVPPRWEAVRDAMPALFDLLGNEPEPAVRAVLGHWLFGYIHPYPDGNGRMARFTMNAFLASGGYPWTVIRVEDRKAYMQALDQASVDLNIGPFASFIAERVRWSLERVA